MNVHTCVGIHHVGKAGFAAFLLHLFPPSGAPSWAGVEHDIQIQNRNSLPHLDSFFLVRSSTKCHKKLQHALRQCKQG